jgi:hypothetical protein
MAVRPSPLTYRCPGCHWSRTVTPRSDVLIPGIDHLRACPDCGHCPLETRAAGTGWGALADLVGQISRLMR